MEYSGENSQVCETVIGSFDMVAVMYVLMRKLINIILFEGQLWNFLTGRYRYRIEASLMQWTRI